jgi:sRNA-binding regulator protein Hfq
MPDPIIDVLKASLAEQTTVAVHLHGERIHGIVTRLDEHAVELRHEGVRSVVRLAAIDAVTTE